MKITFCITWYEACLLLDDPWLCSFFTQLSNLRSIADKTFKFTYSNYQNDERYQLDATIMIYYHK